MGGDLSMVRSLCYNVNIKSSIKVIFKTKNNNLPV